MDDLFLTLPKGFGVPLLYVDGVHKIINSNDVLLILFYKPIQRNIAFDLDENVISITSVEYAFFTQEGEFISYAIGSKANFDVFNKQSSKIAKYNLKSLHADGNNMKESMCNYLQNNINRILINELKHSKEFYGVTPCNWHIIINNNDSENKKIVISKFNKIVEDDNFDLEPYSYKWLFEYKQSKRV